MTSLFTVTAKSLTRDRSVTVFFLTTQVCGTPCITRQTWSRTSSTVCARNDFLRFLLPSSHPSFYSFLVSVGLKPCHVTILTSCFVVIFFIPHLQSGWPLGAVGRVCSCFPARRPFHRSPIPSRASSRRGPGQSRRVGCSTSKTAFVSFSKQATPRTKVSKSVGASIRRGTPLVPWSAPSGNLLRTERGLRGTLPVSW